MAQVTHKVVKDETLGSIAAKYGTTVDAIAKLNNIKDVNLIYVGQVLIISGKTSEEEKQSAGTATNSNFAKITSVGLQSNTENNYFATWTWTKYNTTKEYKVEWDYYTPDLKWFIGDHTTVEQTSIQSSIYSPPSNASYVRVRVKPISTTYKKDNNEVSYWSSPWTPYVTCKVVRDDEDNALPSCDVPSISMEGYKMTCRVDNITGYDETKGEVYVQFEIVKNDTSIAYTGLSKLILNGASYSCSVDVGCIYKARARVKQMGVYGEWSNYSANSQSIPGTPSTIIAYGAASETSVFLAWDKIDSADTYEIEYATNREYLGASNASTTISDIESIQYTVTGLESGSRYYFRVRAVNGEGESGWSNVISVILGTTPSAPTTWSSTTTAVSGEDVILYWVHNSEDGSAEKSAELEVFFDSESFIYTVVNDIPNIGEDMGVKTSQFAINTTSYREGTIIKWRARTSGATNVYGEWSTQRTITVYAPPTLGITVTDRNNNPLSTMTSFPFYIHVFAGPASQMPISCNITIVALESYETVDELGNFKMITKGDEVYNEFHNIFPLSTIKMLPSDVDLQTGIDYRIDCVVAMDSGLTAEDSYIFDVSWVDEAFAPNAEIIYDESQYVTHIRPTCEHYPYNSYLVDYTNGDYVITDTLIPSMDGVSVNNAFTTDGDIVYGGFDDNGEVVYFCIKQSGVSSTIPNVTLSVYRMDTDGKFIEIEKGISNDEYTFVTDPHPNLNIVKYRIVAISNDTGSVSYTDLPGYMIGEKAIILQWNETWNGVNLGYDGTPTETAWTGCRLRLPYNIDVSESNSADVSLVEYIGRENPVSYYGTQVGTTATWNVDIEKSDTDTISMLRQLAVWMGDVYVREPSGTGYWANVEVSFKQTHTEVIIPVTLNITRVSGGK